MSRLAVETVTDSGRLHALAPEWEALAAEAAVEHPFLTHDWVETWWEAFGAGRELHALVVRDAGRAVAIAPLMLGRVKMCGLSLRSLESLANEHTPRGGFLVAKDRPDAYEALWAELSRPGRSFDLVLLRQLPAGSETLGALNRIAAGSGWLEGRWRSEVSPHLRLEGPFAAYLETLSPKHRENIRKREKRARKMGEVSYETVSGGSGLDAALEDGLRIEGSGWKGKEGTAIRCRPDTLSFYTSLARRLAGRDTLELQFLRVGDKRVAFGYTLRHGAGRFMVKSAYDDEFGPISPVMLLIRSVLERAHEEGVREFDFLGGCDPWKLNWTSDTRAHDWLYLMPPSLPLRLMHAAKFRLGPRLRRSPVLSRALGAIRGASRAHGGGEAAQSDRGAA